MNNLLQKIGSNIRSIRLKKGLSIESASAIANIHSTYFAQIERGQRNPTIDVLSQIALALDVKLDSLFPNKPLVKLKDSYMLKFQSITKSLNQKSKNVVLSVVKELARQLEQNF